jgi:hypothetical protein
MEPLELERMMPMDHVLMMPMDALVFAIVSSSCNPLRSRLQHKFDDL